MSDRPFRVLFDVSDSTHLIPVGSYHTHCAYAVEIAGGRAYLAGATPGLEIFDVSNLPNLARLGDYTSAPFSSVAVSGHYAYLASRDVGTTGSWILEVVDVSSPSNCFRIGRYTNTTINALALSGNYAYLAGAGLQVCDVSNPSNCVRLGSFGNAVVYGVAVSGKYAYLAAGYAGLEVIDTSDYDGGNGVMTGAALTAHYPGGHIEEMKQFDFNLLDERSYGLGRTYPECPNYSDGFTQHVIEQRLSELSANQQPQ